MPLIMMNAPPLLLQFTTLPLSSFNKKRHQMSVQCHMRFKFRNTLEYLYLYICLVTHPFTWHIFCLILNLDRYSHAVMKCRNTFIRIMMDSGCSEMFKLRLSACLCKSYKEFNRLWRDDSLSQETSMRSIPGVSPEKYNIGYTRTLWQQNKIE